MWLWKSLIISVFLAVPIVQTMKIFWSFIDCKKLNNKIYQRKENLPISCQVSGMLVLAALN